MIKEMAKSKKRSVGSLEPARDKSAKQVKFTRSSTRQAPPFEDDASDSEVDAGRLESQQFLAMTKAMANQKTSKQTDAHKADFQKMVEGSKEKTVAALKENALHMHELKKSADQNAAFAELLSACCLPDGSNSINPTFSRTSFLMQPSSLPPYSKATALLALSRDHLKIYDGVLDHLSTKRETLPVGEKWEDDCRRLHGVLEAGRKATENQVYELVRGRSRPVGKAGAENTVDPDAPHTWATFTAVEGDPQKGPGWASAAKRAEKDVRRLVKQIPVAEQ